MRGGRLARLALVLAAVAALGGCLLPDSYSVPFDPIAVREGGDGVEILYTSCSPVGVERVEVIQPPANHQWVEDDDPVVWAVRFSPPAKLDAFVVGRRPAEGIEEVPLASPLAERTFYAVRIFLEGDLRLLGGFERFRLAGGKVGYENRYMSAQEFERRSACASPSPGK